MEMNNTRRSFLRTSTVVGLAFVTNGCAVGSSGLEQANSQPSAKGDENAKGGEVTAAEDLMREPGVLRRALLIYSAVAPKLRRNASSIAPDALQKTAKLFRAFGEEYHEWVGGGLIRLRR